MNLTVNQFFDAYVTFVQQVAIRENGKDVLSGKRFMVQKNPDFYRYYNCLVKVISGEEGKIIICV